jgi:hypothetical protein
MLISSLSFACSKEPESMKVMASKRDLKDKFEKLMDKAIDELFK